MALPQKKNDPLLRNSFLAILSLMKHKAEDKNLEPVISISKVLDMMKMSGVSITYDQLTDLVKDPAVQPSIESINKNQLKIRLGDEPEPEMAPQQAPPMPEEEQPQQEEMEPMGDEEELNPEEYRAPNDETAPQQPAAPNRPSIVASMAKRAAHRRD